MIALPEPLIYTPKRYEECLRPLPRALGSFKGTRMEMWGEKRELFGDKGSLCWLTRKAGFIFLHGPHHCAWKSITISLSLFSGLLIKSSYSCC